MSAGRDIVRVSERFLCSQERVIDDVTIVLVGKYTDMHDSYMSVTKSLEHSAFRCNRRLILKVRPDAPSIRLLTFHQWVDSSDLETETQTTNPAKYHDAWRAVVSAESVSFMYPRQCANIPAAVSSFLVGSACAARRA